MRKARARLKEDFESINEQEVVLLGRLASFQPPHGRGFRAVDPVFQRRFKLPHFVEERLVIIPGCGLLLLLPGGAVGLFLQLLDLRILKRLRLHGAIMDLFLGVLSDQRIG